MRSSFLVLLALLAPLLVPVQARAEPDARPAAAPPAETVRLTNGLRVLLAPDPDARLVSVVVDYATGASDDPNGRRGLAHLAEHLVARRTKHIERPFRVLEEAGGWRFNANTTLDDTTYFESLPPERLETALWLESERMGSVSDALTRETFRSERELVRSEERMHTVDGTLTTVWASINRELYPSWHPYSGIQDGTDLDAIGLEDVRAFLATWYVPQNATLVIAGRFDRDETVALVKHYFESLPSAAPPLRPSLPGWSTPSMQLAVTAPIPADQVLLVWRTPAYGGKEDAALDLVAAVLAGRGNERLQRSVVTTHLATSVGARQKSERKESVFYVVANAAPGVNPGVLIRALQTTIDEVARDLTAAEVDRARRLWRDARLAALESTWGRANMLVSLAKAGVEPGPGFDWGYGWYEGLGAPDVANAIATWLGPTRRVATAVFANRNAPGQGSLVVRDEVSP